MKNTRTTRECTPVYFNNIEDKDSLFFTKKTYQVIDNFNIKPFKSKKRMKVDEVDQLLQDKQKELKKMKECMLDNSNSTTKKEKMSWETKINDKRRLVANYLQQQPYSNLAEACRFAHCSYDLAKRVQDDLLFYGRHTEYHYPNQKKQETVDELNKTISKVHGTYSTIGDLKRRHPLFSRKWISRQLRKPQTPKPQTQNPKPNLRVLKIKKKKN